MALQPFGNASGRDAYGACDGARRLARFMALHNMRARAKDRGPGNDGVRARCDRLSGALTILSAINLDDRTKTARMASTARTSSASRPKSADKIDGATMIDRCGAASGTAEPALNAFDPGLAPPHKYP